MTSRSTPGTRDATVTVAIAVVALAAGVTLATVPNLPGQSFAPTGGGHLAIAAGVTALVLVAAGLIPRRGWITCWRLATEVAIAANLVLVLDSGNVVHRRSLDPPLLALAAAAAAIGVAVLHADRPAAPDV